MKFTQVTKVIYHQTTVQFHCCRVMKQQQSSAYLIRSDLFAWRKMCQLCYKRQKVHPVTFLLQMLSVGSLPMDTWDTSKGFSKSSICRASVRKDKTPKGKKKTKPVHLPTPWKTNLISTPAAERLFVWRPYRGRERDKIKSSSCRRLNSPSYVFARVRISMNAHAPILWRRSRENRLLMFPSACQSYESNGCKAAARKWVSSLLRSGSVCPSTKEPLEHKRKRGSLSVCLFPSFSFFFSGDFHTLGGEEPYPLRRGMRDGDGALASPEPGIMGLRAIFWRCKATKPRLESELIPRLSNAVRWSLSPREARGLCSVLTQFDSSLIFLESPFVPTSPPLWSASLISFDVLQVLL